MSLAVSVPEQTALTETEQTDLVRLECVIEGGLKAFIEVGRALREIRDRRLYRDTHETFERYVNERWEVGRAHAYRLIAAAETAEILSPIGDIPLPANESQIRPLLQFPAEHRGQVWTDVIKICTRNGGGEPLITAKEIDKAVNELLVIRKDPIYKRRYKAICESRREHNDTTRATRSIPLRPTCPNCGSHEVDEDGDCAQCREPGVGASKPAEQNNPPKVRGVGIIRANEAINALRLIPKNDGLRAAAWEMIRSWLDANE